MIPRKLKNFSLFVDGRGYAGRIEEMTPPVLARHMEDYRAGGMEAPIEIDLGQEKLECTFALGEYNEDVLRQYGCRDHAGVQLRMTGALERDSVSRDITAVEISLRGRWREIDQGDWKGGENSVMKVSVSCSYYKLTMNDEVLIEMDVENLVHIVAGEDRLAPIRAALGI